MVGKLKKLINDNQGALNKYHRLVVQIERLRPKYEQFSDDELQNQTILLRKKYQSGSTLAELLPEAFATVVEACARVLGLRPFTVQILGGIVLHYGDIAEMKTGEGKTLTATMPVYLNAITGLGVHVITVNEYLSTRDYQQMGPLYEWLGLSVGLNLNNQSIEAKQAAYRADITFTTDSELGFDYLKDNMVWDIKNQMQRGMAFALLDEVDSILIDESKSPLVIAGAIDANSTLYERSDRFVKGLLTTEYEIDLESRVVSLNKEGIYKAQRYFGLKALYAPENTVIVHHIAQALSANLLYTRDKDYIVGDNQVKIVDQFTGRVMASRSFSNGLHQALESKERLPISSESNVFASTTYQTLFRKYHKLAGMTGTALTDQDEFLTLYNMRVIQIPTNRPSRRVDAKDRVFATIVDKYAAIVQKVVALHATGQPVLVGTASIETSEKLSAALAEVGITHNVLNAKNDAYEASIIKSAGQKNAVTIATNMAGRGTDIRLGEGVSALGGLFIIGTERHEARRIDNQLRGRAGRQGDPGASQFFVSLEDDLIINNATDRTKSLIAKMMASKNETINQRFIRRQTVLCQLSAEGGSYNARRSMLQYEDIINSQRDVIYEQRQQVIAEPELLDWVLTPIIKRSIERQVDHFTKGKQRAQWDYAGLLKYCGLSMTRVGQVQLADLTGLNRAQIKDYLEQVATETYEKKLKQIGTQERQLEYQKTCIITAVDNDWQAHMNQLIELKDYIRLRGYAQINPLVDYQLETFELFKRLVEVIEDDITRIFFKSVIQN